MTAAGVDSPRFDAELLLAAATGLTRAQIVADPGRLIEPAEARAFADMARRRREREPVAYILGSKPFRSIELKVDPRVLIPRPETEHLVEAALGLPEGARVVDVGTGSGAVALALKAERPDLEVLATDASAAALSVARANALLLGLGVTLFEGDLLAPVAGRVDAVVSNPPYVPEGDGDRLAPEIARYEPAEALFAGADGLAVHRRMIPAARAAGAGFVALEVGEGQAEPVAALLREAGYGHTAADRDLAGIERVVRGW
ncbi:MAG: peptide chain release factor N(5)-glutamine methyltransferase [Actinomycetota bacterium]|nr:peptide chain release factor N(5)-glutamine methyltransferase [Actinomycetota bacterium]